MHKEQSPRIAVLLPCYNEEAAIAQTIAQSHKTAEFVALEAVGHYPQEDSCAKVSDALATFLRRR